MKESSFGDVVDVGQEGEGGIKYDAKVADCTGGGDNGAVDVEGKVVGGAGEGIWTNEENLGFIAVKLHEVLSVPGFYFS